MWSVMLIVLWMLNHPCIPGINPTWSWWIIFLMYCWILLTSTLVRIFASMFIRDIVYNSFWWSLLGFLCTVSCHLWRGRIWLLLCHFECLLFLFVAWLLRLGLLVLCWIAVVRVDIPVIFLILVERLPVFSHWEWYWLWAFRRWLLRCWGMFLLSLHSEEFWSGMDAVFCQMLSLHYWEDHMVLGFSLVDMIYHIDCFTSVESAVYPGDKSYLVTVNNLLNVLLDPIG